MKGLTVPWSFPTFSCHGLREQCYVDGSQGNRGGTSCCRRNDSDHESVGYAVPCGIPPLKVIN